MCKATAQEAKQIKTDLGNIRGDVMHKSATHQSPTWPIASCATSKSRKNCLSVNMSRRLYMVLQGEIVAVVVVY